MQLQSIPFQMYRKANTFRESIKIQTIHIRIRICTAVNSIKMIKQLTCKHSRAQQNKKGKPQFDKWVWVHEPIFSPNWYTYAIGSHNHRSPHNVSQWILINLKTCWKQTLKRNSSIWSCPFEVGSIIDVFKFH